MGRMFLVVIDAYSKWPEMAIKKSVLAKNMGRLQSIFVNKSVPEISVSENGPQFVSEVFAVFMRGNVIKHLGSAPYHPATNGQAELFVKALKHVLHKGQAV